jgi:hypothetical protein
MVFLIEAFVSRVGWRLPDIDLRSRAPKPKPVPAVVILEEPVEEVVVAPEESPGEKRRERFARAKEGR